MTYNNGFVNHKNCKSDRDCEKCKLKKILLECGQGTGNRSFTSSDDAPFEIANVTINTTCLGRPEVLVKFSSLVRFTNLAVTPNTATIRLKYELFRACDDAEPISLGTWMFEEIDVFEDSFKTIKQSFNFIFCESLKCSGCCSYFVRVTPIEIINATAIVSNGMIAFLTKDLCHNLEDNCETSGSIYYKGAIPIHHRSKDIILACGQGNDSIVFKESGLQLSADIAHITIDTTCLNKPKALIEFSSVIQLSDELNDAILRFELFRMGGGSEPVSRGTWIFEITNSGEVLSKAFGFIFCECETLSKCCEYFVKATPIRIESGTSMGVDDTVTVLNARMAALAQPSKDTLNYDNYKTSDDQSDYDNYKSLRTKPKEIVLECGSSAGTRTFISSSDVPFQLAHVTIDTAEFCKPIVNIQFSSIVGFQLLGERSSLHLRYELFRTCDNRIPVSLGIWELQIINEQSEPKKTTEAFDFIFCDYITRPGCCDYFVMVTPIEVMEVSGVPTVATVSNGRIAALAGERY